MNHLIVDQQVLYQTAHDISLVPVHAAAILQGFCADVVEENDGGPVEITDSRRKDRGFWWYQSRSDRTVRTYGAVLQQVVVELGRGGERYGGMHAVLNIQHD